MTAGALLLLWLDPFNGVCILPLRVLQGGLDFGWNFGWIGRMSVVAPSGGSCLSAEVDLCRARPRALPLALGFSALSFADLSLDRLERARRLIGWR